MKTEELIRYYKANIEAIEKGLNNDSLSADIDTEDYVFGFKKTLRKRTKSMAKALQLERKLRNDVGRYLSASVRVVAVRLYNNGELRGEFKA